MHRNVGHLVEDHYRRCNVYLREIAFTPEMRFPKLEEIFFQVIRVNTPVYSYIMKIVSGFDDA